jgi:hypothetical protein
VKTLAVLACSEQSLHETVALTCGEQLLRRGAKKLGPPESCSSRLRCSLRNWEIAHAAISAAATTATVAVSSGAMFNSIYVTAAASCQDEVFSR